MRAFTIFLLVLFCSNTILGQKKMPNIILNDLEGKKIATNTISKNNTVVLSLWSTKCAPCKKGLKAINKVYSQWQETTGVKVYAISVDDSKSKKVVEKIAKQGNWSFGVLLDDKKQFKKALGARAVPLTLVIKNNKIVYRQAGYKAGSVNELYKVIKQHS